MEDLITILFFPALLIIALGFVFLRRVFDNKYFQLAILVVIASFFRLKDLLSPLWADEAWFYFLAFDSCITQEFIHAYLTNLIGLKDEFWLRIFPAICGILTVPAIYFTVKEYKFQIALLVAVLPLFTLWSTVARPYSIAGLFLVLSIKHWAWMIPALLSSPIALIGLIFQKKQFVISTVLIGIAVLFARADIILLFNRIVEFIKDFDLLEALSQTRLYYLPALLLLIYISRFNLKYLHIPYWVLIGFSLVQSNDLSGNMWYSKEVIFANWRDIPAVKYTTNVLPHLYYSGNKSLYIREENLKQFKNEDTVWVAIDYYALKKYSRDIISVPDYLHGVLKQGWVITVPAYKGELLWAEGYRWYR